MKKHIFFVAVIVLVILSTTPIAQEHPARPNNIKYLESICKLWGKIKFTHPYIPLKNIDWDAALIETLPLVRSAESREEFRQAIVKLLSFLDDPATRVVDKRTDVAWDSKTRTTDKDQPFLEQTDDGITIIVANNYSRFNLTATSYRKLQNTFNNVFREAAKSDKILIDFRNLRGFSRMFPVRAFQNSITSVLTKDIQLAPLRVLEHLGYESQFNQTFAYHSALSVRSSGVLRAQGKDLPAPHIVILLNRSSAGFEQITTALQEENVIDVVFEGDVPNSEGSITSYMSLDGGILVRTRIADILRKDGSIGFSPDLTVPENAREAGLKILRGQTKLSKSTDINTNIPEPSEFYNFTDKAYADMEYPNEDYRMLALFRFWNVIEYFFPYKNLLDHSWDSVLREFIPRMDKIKDAQEYATTILRLAAKIQDSHGTVISKQLGEFYGSHYPPIRIDFIEGQSVITDIEGNDNDGFEIGDVIVSIDGVPAQDLRKQWEPYIAASTPGRLQKKIDYLLLSGKENSTMKIELKKSSGQLKEVEVKRTIEGAQMWYRPPKLPTSTVLPEGLGYIDLSTLERSDVDKALKEVKDTPGLILDMRRYPVGGSWLLGQKIAGRSFDFARLEFIVYDGSTGRFSRREELQSLPSISGKSAYQGKIAMLVGSGTQSAAEHVCLIMESAADVTFIGSPSSGANGNISDAILPGGIRVIFTALGVRHLDGRQLQRKGIQPDIHVERTIEGVRQGKDEVLEKAIEFLTDQTSK